MDTTNKLSHGAGTADASHLTGPIAGTGAVSAGIWPSNSYTGVLDMTSTCEILTRIRGDEGLGELEVAQKAGISLEHYYDLESHEGDIAQTLTLSEFVSLASALRMSAQEFTKSILGLASASATPINLRERRILSGYSLRKLSDELGFEENIVNGLESDNITMIKGAPLFLILDFERALGVEFGALLLNCIQKILGPDSASC